MASASSIDNSPLANASDVAGRSFSRRAASIACFASPFDVPFWQANQSSDDADCFGCAWHASTRSANAACLAVNRRITFANRSTAMTASAPVRTAGSV